MRLMWGPGRTLERTNNEMTPEAQRIAIAAVVFNQIKLVQKLTPHQRTDHSLLYGGEDSFGLWIWLRPDGSFFGMNYDSKEQLESGEIKEIAKRKDYPNDLNAMHEAEKILLSKQGLIPHELGVNLLTICQRDNNKAYYATAAQRAEAFLKTLGLWKEECDPQTHPGRGKEMMKSKQRRKNKSLTFEDIYWPRFLKSAKNSAKIPSHGPKGKHN